MLQPQSILLAGKEPGVWADYPHNTRIIPLITPSSFSAASTTIQSSASVDVTGGMAAKVQLMLQTVQSYPEITVSIFSGEEKGSISAALREGWIGHNHQDLNPFQHLIVQSTIITETERENHGQRYLLNP